MKKIILVVLFLLLLVGGYFYVYKEHRDIAKEEVSYDIAVPVLFSEYQSNESAANTKYLDKTIEVSGKVSSLNMETKSIVLDEKLFATFLDKIPSTIKPNSQIKIKGRLIGYDSLLEEIKMDQCIILN
ncbi:hypothetical protein EOD40_15845 [Flavobacterium sufflavum]|uniref:tRNA_anti-like n=1 Tax=Flavobacterium sufflavum TaxID=1921138 RepID=A0A437KM57_9FLAO|nr:hypothetical protein [Flavobacterium sufflavum]RVT72270.1 hypothetical protein EOD40_15845 [Flavobacterium sufflavum]